MDEALEDYIILLCGNLNIQPSAKAKINRKFRATTEIGSTFFGCLSVTGQMKK
jgi:hypothetical protein